MIILRYALLSMIVFFFAGCYEVTEEIVISGNGSGTYLTKMDMSALLEMMQTMAGEDELTKGGLDKAIDTTIQMRSVIDSAKDMPAAQKELFQEGTMKLKMNIREKIFNADIFYPFRNFDQLQLLMSGTGTGGLADVFKKVYGSDSASAASGSSSSDQGLGQVNNIFDITIKKGMVSKKLNEERYKALMEKPEIVQAKQMATSGMEILYTTIIKFPKPVKKTDNPMIKLSADKKTATINYNLLSLFDTPDNFSYTILY